MSEVFSKALERVVHSPEAFSVNLRILSAANIIESRSNENICQMLCDTISFLKGRKENQKSIKIVYE